MGEIMQLKSMFPSNKTVTQTSKFVGKNPENKLKVLESRLEEIPTMDILLIQIDNLEKDPRAQNFSLKLRQIEKQANDRNMFEKQYHLERITQRKMQEMKGKSTELGDPEGDIAKLSKKYTEIKARVYKLLNN